MKKSIVKQTLTQTKNGDVNLNVTCSSCGKDITVTNKYGMFCDDLCGIEEAKIAYHNVSEMVDGIIGIFNQWK